MNDIKVLNSLVDFLENYGLKVDFISTDDEKVAIAELSQHTILVNTLSRDTIGMIFTIAHLFGHYIQFANYDKYKVLIQQVKKEPKPIELPTNFKEDFYNYELEAFEIGKCLLQNITNFDEETERKYQIFFETDFDLFFDYLTKGIQQTPDAFNVELKKRFKSDRKKRVPLNAKEFPKTPVYLHDINLIVY